MLAYLSKIIKFNTVNVVGIIKTDEDETYNVLTVNKKGSKIVITNRRLFQSFEELKQKIDSKLPVLLVIDGKGILNKQIVLGNEADMNWQRNIDHKNIYLTSYKTDVAHFMSFCRKANVLEITEKFQKEHFHVLDVFVGSIIAALLQTSIQKNTIHSGDLVLEFEKDTLTQYTKTNDSNSSIEYKIGEDVVNNKQLPLYGALLQFFIKSDKIEKTQLDSLNNEELLYKKAFNYFGAATLIGFLISLTVSFLLIQHYGTKTAELNLQSVYSSQAYKQIQELEKQKEKQLVILNESGFMSSKFLSYYSYEIIKGTPGIIILSELNIIPVIEKEIKADKKINFETKQIILKGESINESAINNWFAGLRKMKWIKKFEIISLKKDKKKCFKV